MGKKIKTEKKEKEEDKKNGKKIKTEKNKKKKRGEDCSAFHYELAQ